MKKRLYIIGVNLLYISIIIFASCKIPDYDDKITAVENIPSGDVIKETEEIQEMELKPIKNYGAYIFTDQKKLFGIDGKSKIELFATYTDENRYPVNDFFKKGGIIYFNIKVMEKGEAIPETDPVQYESVEKIYYYVQDNGIILNIDESEYPEKPELIFATMAEGLFQIFDHEYNGAVYSRVMRHTEVTAFKQIDSFYYTPGGLWFSVPETLQTRLKGVYFYDKDFSTNLTQFPDITGRIWK